MSRLRSDHKPSLLKSSVPLQPRRVLRSNTAASQSVQIPTGSQAKSQTLPRSSDIDEAGPEYQTISRQLRELAKKVNKDLADENMDYVDEDTVTPAVFERGRFYDEYSARRSERLKQKKGETGEKEKDSVSVFEKGRFYDLYSERRSERLKRKLDETGEKKDVGVSGESKKKKLESMKTAGEGRGYFLRSSCKEGKKPAMPAGIKRIAPRTGRPIEAKESKKPVIPAKVWRN